MWYYDIRSGHFHVNPHVVRDACHSVLENNGAVGPAITLCIGGCPGFGRAGCRHLQPPRAPGSLVAGFCFVQKLLQGWMLAVLHVVLLLLAEGAQKEAMQ